jgi:hypothetical protein
MTDLRARLEMRWQMARKRGKSGLAIALNEHEIADILAALPAEGDSLWRTAAYLKVRTRTAIAERIRAGDPAAAVAAEYRVPREWIEKIADPGFDFSAEPAEGDTQGVPVFCAHCEVNIDRCPTCGKQEWRIGPHESAKPAEGDSHTLPQKDDPDIVERALAFVAEFKGDGRAALNCFYSEALAAEVAALRAQLEQAQAENARLREALTEQTERACRFNCDAESACECPAHQDYRAALGRKVERLETCERCQMRLPERLMTFGVGVRGGTPARCAACTPVLSDEDVAKRGEVIALRRSALTGPPPETT